MHILSFGEVLWDLIDGEEHLGGAPLNFAVSSARLGSRADLVSAVGDDRLGRQALSRMRVLGLSIDAVEVVATAATGVALVDHAAPGSARFSIPRPAAFDQLRLAPAQLTALCATAPDWIYYGTLAQTTSENLMQLKVCLELTPRAQRFYDINLRTGHWNYPLVVQLSQLATVLKMNDEEAECLHQVAGFDELFTLETFCRRWAAAHRIAMICVTRGAQGCAIWSEGNLRTYPGFSIQVADTVGAGDAFAAAFLHGLHEGWPLARVAAFANAAGALVASRNGATPDWQAEECFALMAGHHQALA